MQPLEKTLRNKLEKTIKSARDIAEDAARAALEQLGVGEPTAYPHLTETDRVLRRKLRAHGRQLGNGRDAKGRQELDRLIEEVAYEHWHRMLFARFLAENNLLMYPDPDDPVAVTLEECEDLAADEGAQNGWELAARFAARMLPQIFRPDSPVFKLMLPPEHQQKLEGLVTELPQQVFTASDSLGWVYQFWQAKKKDEVNASEVKIGARELPAVTQLFTEPYMVSFLLDNSLGAWWAARRLSEADLRNATSEEELRNKAAIPGVPLEYLRFVQQENGTWTPAAGTFDSWPEHLSELKTLDPCCGSGHFLVAAFLMLVPMRIKRDGLDAREAVDAVLRENIHGLELDQRCVELAAFALALTAWRYPGTGGYRPLPELNVACSGLAISAKKEEWLALAGVNTNLRLALEELYKQFKDAPVLGSLINPEASLGKGSLFELKWDEVEPLLTKALAGEKDDEIAEMGVAAKGIARAAVLLAQRYNWIITNVPYLVRGKQSDVLRSYCKFFFEQSKDDLATVFIERSLLLAEKNGTCSVVMPQHWMFQKRSEGLRRKLIEHTKINFIARLGAGAFETISGETVKVALFIFSNSAVDPMDSIAVLDYELAVSSLRADSYIRIEKTIEISQKLQANNPGAYFELSKNETKGRLGDACTLRGGITTGDAQRHRFFFWEITDFRDWEFQQTTVKITSDFSGRSHVIRWADGKGALAQAEGSTIAGRDVWGKHGIAITHTGDIKSTLYTGQIYENIITVCIPKDSIALSAIWEFCSSTEFHSAVRTINQKLRVDVQYFARTPFDLDHWIIISEEKHPNGLPKPYSEDLTQWIFHGHICGSVVWNKKKKLIAIGPMRTDGTVLQTAVARLLGYRWPAETDSDMELSDESRALVKKSQALLPFADEDGIVCIPAVRGEMKAEDRLLSLLAAAHKDVSVQSSGNSKDTDNCTLKTDHSFSAWLNQLLADADHSGKSLDTWLRDKFFIQHCKLFHHRPFIWHIWDGLHDGFAALINYHKLDAKLLETLIYTYLGDWISRQKQDIASGVDGAQEKLAAAEALKKKLELILEGEDPYDIFVRWKPIEKQPIGWNPDPNDGVRLNIRPFMTVGDIKKKGAGVLRDKPNIKWEKDRGKDVESAPWYSLFKGNRINDHHLTLNEKLDAQRKNRK